MIRKIVFIREATFYVVDNIFSARTALAWPAARTAPQQIEQIQPEVRATAGCGPKPAQRRALVYMHQCRPHHDILCRLL